MSGKGWHSVGGLGSGTEDRLQQVVAEPAPMGYLKGPRSGLGVGVGAEGRSRQAWARQCDSQPGTSTAGVGPRVCWERWGDCGCDTSPPGPSVSLSDSEEWALGAEELGGAHVAPEGEEAGEGDTGGDRKGHEGPRTPPRGTC